MDQLVARAVLFLLPWIVPGLLALGSAKRPDGLDGLGLVLLLMPLVAGVCAAVRDYWFTQPFDMLG